VNDLDTVKNPIAFIYLIRDNDSEGSNPGRMISMNLLLQMLDVGGNGSGSGGQRVPVSKHL